MVLVVEDEITLSTRYGSSQIQLMLGDITHLPLEEKVDVVFTSAFPGDYSCVKGTLIHALYKNLDISVRQLAKNKELDLTRMFSCWMSKPLPPDKPYRRLVCFEVNHTQTLTEQISMMFRATMPIFNGNENTVITPPLATGCQGVPVEQMLGVMVNTACHWIKAGLPLKCLKLVLFARDLDQARDFLYKSSINLFTNLKNKWHAKENKTAITRCFDVTFSYHLDNKKKVTKLSEIMKEEEKSLTIHQDYFKMKEDQSWQDEVFDTMANSKRIIIVLTPLFVSDKWCLDQFNLAVCCNRFKGTEMVIPFYLETVDSFPSYMNLIQYHDCRGTDQESSEQKVFSACKNVIEAVHCENAVVDSQNKTTSDMETKPVPVYDVFISYCHRTASFAKLAVEFLSTNYPDIKVFFDRSELKTGNIWQQALYEAVDKTRCLVAMLSDEYVKSAVCQEEYNISLARLLAQDDFLLVPVCLPELSTISESYTKTKAVSVSSREDVEQLIKKIIPTVLKLKGLTERKDRETRHIQGILEQQRYLYFSKFFEFDWDKKEVRRRNTTNVTEDFSSIEARISFSYASDGMKYAAVLTDMLQQQGENITCNLLSYSQVEARKEIDNADMVVMFLSNEFLQSQHHMEELHIAMCRQRLVKDRTVIYLVEVSPITEGFYYPSILPFHVSLDDIMWERFKKVFEFGVKRYNVYKSGLEGTYMCSPTDFVALQMMNLDVLRLLSQRGKGTELHTNLVNVVRFEKFNREQEDKDQSPKEVAIPVSSYVAPKATWDDDETESEGELEATIPEKTVATERETDPVDTHTTFITSPYDIDITKNGGDDLGAGSDKTKTTEKQGSFSKDNDNDGNPTASTSEGDNKNVADDQENSGLIHLSKKYREDMELIQRYMEGSDLDNDADDQGKEKRSSEDNKISRNRKSESSKSCYIL